MNATHPARYDEHPPALIVGGGLVGLSAALFLAWQDVPCLLVERHPDLLIHPRARGFTPRTVELFRQVGLEPAIRAASYASGDAFAWTAVRADTLADAVYLEVEEPEDEVPTAHLSPAPFAPIDQDRLELLLRERATALGAELRFATELVDFTQDPDGVTARLVDRRTGAEQVIRADYLIAADGYASPVRRRLGIPTDGPGPFFHTITAMVEADLTPALRGRPLSIAYLQQPRPGTILMAHSQDGQRWVFGMGYAPDKGEAVDDFTDDRVAELVRQAAGLPEVSVTIRPQIPGTGIKVLGFTIGAQLARQYRQGRVFLAGDAAHIVPPTGGLGANAGIQDAHNLAWKLAAVIRGQAGPALLDTYHDERHAVGQFIMQQALARWQARIAGADSPPLVDYATVIFGSVYRSAAVLGAPAGADPALPATTLIGQPGTRAPHVEFGRDGQPISTIDLYGRRFVLLTGPDGGAWAQAAERVAGELGLPLDVYRVGSGGDLDDPEARFAAAHGVTESGALLVRPDGIVAWRAAAAAADPARALAAALRRILAR
ncbi:MAG: FAD-dependent monooxygenase [Sphaerobacter sp.]|nr:FAD-dependent monooxygenase [Sphaerobacter sp.]